MQEEWGHEMAAEALPAEGVVEGEVLEAVPIYAEEGMKEIISQEEEAPGTVVFEYREDDGGRWHPYDEATCQRLEHASRQGDARVSLPGRRRYTAIGIGEENEDAIGLGEENQDGMILGDSRFTASSEFSGNCTVATGRLNKPGARWAPTSNDMHAGTSWMQVKLPGARLIGRIATQGNGSYQEWTTAYRVKHSMDGETWVDYAQKLDGNADQHTVVTHDFEPPFECKFVRVLPTSWHRHACLRIELYQTSAEPEETEVRFGVPAWESPTGIAETNPADGSTRVVRRVVRDPGVEVRGRASVFEGGAAIVEEEEEEEDEEEEEAEQRRRAAEAEAARERRQRLAAEAEAKAAEERRQRLAAEAQAAEAERKLRAAEAAAADKKRREAAAAAEAERRRRAANEAINAFDNYGYTKLNWAAYKGDVRKTRELLQAGADPNIIAKGDRMTPLAHAAWAGHPEIAQILLNHPWMDVKKFGKHALRMANWPMDSGTRTCASECNFGGLEGRKAVGDMIRERCPDLINYEECCAVS